MDNLIEQIMSGKFQDARASIVERLNTIRETSFVQMKSMIGDSIGASVDAQMTEDNVVHRGRITLIRRRIRKGKIQRNVRKVAAKGYTIRKGKLTRIPAAQRIHMRLKARRAAIKRRAKFQQSLRKRKMSMRKRTAMGIK